MKLQTRYITLDEFRVYSGIDLLAELKTNSNPSDEANAWLVRLEDRMEAFLNATFFKNVSDLYPCFTDHQKEHYKKALLEQGIYVFQNGDIATDSGLDPETGEKFGEATRNKKVIAPAAKWHLKQCGLWNGHIGGPSFFGGLWFR